MTMKKSVFVIDDHTAIREGFKAILDRSEGFVVTGEAATAEDLLARLDAGEACPDLFIVDISLPGMDGIELIGVLRTRTRARAVVLSMHRRYDYIAKALRAGASGYVAKDAGVDCIVSALSAAAAGGVYLDPTSLRLYVDETLSGERDRAEGPSFMPRAPESASCLSEREEEVLELLAAGKRSEAIAADLGLSQKTVENHLSNITTKLGVHNRFELYRIAARMGKE
jgi:DNA-binding NarL/FixJ family response regulator